MAEVKLASLPPPVDVYKRQGITRAQRTLNLSWCKRRRRAREDLVREPSRFIEEMGLDDPTIKEDETTAAMNPKERMAMLKALLKK